MPRPTSGSPDELVDDPGHFGAGDRAYSQLPPAAIGVLRQSRSDARLLKQAPDDGGSAIAFAAGPPHVDAEAFVVQRPDGQAVRTGGSEVRRHVRPIGTCLFVLKREAGRLGRSVAPYCDQS